MGRVALVTGGTRGIGREISIALAAEGHTVAANYAGNETAAKAFTAETNIKAYKFDVGDYAACEAAIKRIENDLGSIEILVNNAGITRDAMLHKMTLEQWTAVIRADLDSLFNVTRHVIGGMRDRGFGRIVNISSINGQKGQRGQTNYGAAKAGVIGFTKSLALENANQGITVNAVAPGYIATDMVAAVPEEVIRTKVIPQIPVGRLGTAHEIARCVVFLAHDDSSFITGSTLSANGAQYLA